MFTCIHCICLTVCYLLCYCAGQAGYPRSCGQGHVTWEEVPQEGANPSSSHLQGQFPVSILIYIVFALLLVCCALHWVTVSLEGQAGTSCLVVAWD